MSARTLRLASVAAALLASCVTCDASAQQLAVRGGIVHTMAGPAIRDGYYKIGKYDGLIKTYNKPFTKENHDAVNENDYVWTQFIDNQILPVGMKK